MISFRQKGNFSKTFSFLERAKESFHVGILDKYGARGVELLKSATPSETGRTADSWYYKIEQSDGKARLIFCNSHVNKGVQIALILQYGHGTGTGGWVEGRDYLNPVLTPLFEQMANELWKEVSG